MKLKSLRYWSIVGLVVPVFFLVINSMLDYGTTGHGWENLMLTLWPSSFFFMALHGDHGNGLSAFAILVYATSIGTNVLLYSVIGATFLVMNSYRTHHKVGESISLSSVKLLSIIYGIYAAGSLFGVPLFLGTMYGPAFLNLLDVSYHVNVLPIAGIVNTTVSIFIAYSFWQSHCWGRYLAISYNAIWLASFLIGFAFSRLTGPPPGDPVALALLLSLVFLAFPATIIVFCLRSDVKELMCKNLRPIPQQDTTAGA